MLSGVSFSANPGQPIGLVGVNGSGKTTLLRIIAGEMVADGGRIEMPPGMRVGYLPQGRSFADGETIAEAFPLIFAGEISPETRLAEVAEALATASDPADVARLETEYDDLLGQLSESSERPSFDDIALRTPDPATIASTLSGGEVTKLALLELAAQQPNILLLDEPTNHLDIAGIEWLEGYVHAFAGAVIIVSHDRSLLDACAVEIVELDAREGGAETFAGNYSAYAEEKARRREDQWARYRLQQREEAHLKRVVSTIESRTRSIENSTIDFAIRKKAAKVMRRGVTLRARLERQADSADRVEKPQAATQAFAGSFSTDDHGRARLLLAENVALEIGGRRLFDGLSFDVSRGQRVALLGPNGSGKTTFFRAILGEIGIAGGLLEVAGSARVGYLPQGETLDDGDLDRTPIELFRRDREMSTVEANNLLHRFLFGHDRASRPLREMSYGERRRLALARLVLRGANLLLLDEPTNHLDIPSREAFETALDAFEGGALVVTHDRYFIERFADTVVEL